MTEIYLDFKCLHLIDEEISLKLKIIICKECRILRIISKNVIKNFDFSIIHVGTDRSEQRRIGRSRRLDDRKRNRIVVIILLCCRCIHIEGCREWGMNNRGVVELIEEIIQNGPPCLGNEWVWKPIHSTMDAWRRSVGQAWRQVWRQTSPIYATQ